MGKNSDKKWDVLIIGAGASGMMAAITAARAGKHVIIFEQQNKAGKKLLATGNGKCNFTNEHMQEDCYGGDTEFISHVLKQFSVNDCLSFFHSIGIYPKCKNGYYYPNSEQASSVVNALVEELKRLNVTICYEAKITNICPKGNFVSLSTHNGIYCGKKLIVATGLLASPKLGSDGSLFEHIKALGHRFSPILPALCGFYCKEINFKKITGVRSFGLVTAYVDNQKIAEDKGEIQFTDYGLSGIPIFQISRYLSKDLYYKKDVYVSLNFFPEHTSAELLNELNYRKQILEDSYVEHFLNGLINQKLASIIIEKANISPNIFVNTLTDRDILKILDLLQNLKINVIKPREFEFAQVCTGGIPISDIDMYTLESKLQPNIYFAGEILDIDGICGGYNLHFAWATGYIAGL